MQALLFLLIMFQCPQCPPPQGQPDNQARYNVPESYTFVWRNTGSIQSRFDTPATLASGREMNIPIVNGWVPEIAENNMPDGTVRIVFDYRKQLDYGDYKYRKISYLAEDVARAEQAEKVRERRYPPPTVNRVERADLREEVKQEKPAAKVIETVEPTRLPETSTKTVKPPEQGVLPKQELPEGSGKPIKPSEVKSEENPAYKKVPDYGKKE